METQTKDPPPLPPEGASWVVRTGDDLPGSVPKEGGAEKEWVFPPYLAGRVLLRLLQNHTACGGAPGELIIGIPGVETVLWPGLIPLG